MQRAITFFMVLGLAASVSATTITLDTDKATYKRGEIATVTATLTTDGTEPVTIQVLLGLSWNGSLTTAAGPGQQQLLTTSDGGGTAFTWLGSSEYPCLASSCILLDQLSPFFVGGGSVPDAGVITSVLPLTLGQSLGSLDFQLGITSVFGLTPALGTNL